MFLRKLTFHNSYSIMWGPSFFCRVFWDLNKHLRTTPDSLIFIKHNYSSALNPLEELLIKHREHELHKKIIYNDILIKKTEKKPIEPKVAEPIFLKYLSENKSTVNDDSTEESTDISFPYEIKREFLNQPTFDKAVTETVPQSVLDTIPAENFEETNSKWKLKRVKLDKKNLEDPKKWNYLEENYVNLKEIDLEIAGCDPKKPMSSVPCGGCGAFLHCQDVSIPGFLPKDVFENKTKQELEKEICQRCLFLKEFDVALGVNVSPSEYPKILTQIRKKNCLAIVMVDLLDFPCSYWPDISEIIGYTKPIVIVGNKFDLIEQKDPHFVKHVKHCLLSSLAKEGLNIKNVKHVSLISAKTGFGVKMLIDHLFKNWEYKGDVFIIGCTNVGKSTLFNTLIQSDYCSVLVKDIFHRATVSAWPGTTLKLLKFPITRPYLWQISTRTSEISVNQDMSFEQIPLQGYEKSVFLKNSEKDDLHHLPKAFDPQSYNPSKCRWCFDTPGAVKYDQIINLLTTSELLLTLPKAKLIPRNFHLKPGMTLFIGGLARLDYVEGPELAWFTVFACQELPVTVTNLEDANSVYELLLGSVLFRVPMGGKERLAKWPKLSPKNFEIIGKKDAQADADIVLSSAGWVAVNINVGYKCSITAWTPEKKGIYVRNEALIKGGHKIKGERIKNTPAFRIFKEK